MPLNLAMVSERDGHPGGDLTISTELEQAGFCPTASCGHTSQEQRDKSWGRRKFGPARRGSASLLHGVTPTDTSLREESGPCQRLKGLMDLSFR